MSNQGWRLGLIMDMGTASVQSLWNRALHIRRQVQNQNIEWHKGNAWYGRREGHKGFPDVSLRKRWDSERDLPYHCSAILVYHTRSSPHIPAYPPRTPAIRIRNRLNDLPTLAGALLSARDAIHSRWRNLARVGLGGRGLGVRADNEEVDWTKGDGMLVFSNFFSAIERYTDFIDGRTPVYEHRLTIFNA